MNELLNYLNTEYEMIVFDTPPLEYIPDALVLNSKIKNLLLVVRWGKTRLNRLADRLVDLTDSRDDVRGIIINASKEMSSKDSYSYSYYHY